MAFTFTYDLVTTVTIRNVPTFTYSLYFTFHPWASHLLPQISTRTYISYAQCTHILTFLLRYRYHSSFRPSHDIVAFSVAALFFSSSAIVWASASGHIISVLPRSSSGRLPYTKGSQLDEPLQAVATGTPQRNLRDWYIYRDYMNSLEYVALSS